MALFNLHTSAKFLTPSELVLKARSMLVSASSTLVYAAQLIQ